MKQFVIREHEIEPVAGLPGELPVGEVILWQGRPSARLVARHSVKSLWIGGYFLVLAIWAAASGLSDGQPLGGIAFSIAVLTGLAAIVLGMIELFAWGVERTTLYTITSERVVMAFRRGAVDEPEPAVQSDQCCCPGQARGQGGNDRAGIARRATPVLDVAMAACARLAFCNARAELICLTDAEAVSDILALAYARHATMHAAMGG